MSEKDTAASSDGQPTQIDERLDKLEKRVEERFERSLDRFSRSLFWIQTIVGLLGVLLVLGTIVGGVAGVQIWTLKNNTLDEIREERAGAKCERAVDALSIGQPRGDDSDKRSFDEAVWNAVSVLDEQEQRGASASKEVVRKCADSIAYIPLRLGRAEIFSNYRGRVFIYAKVFKLGTRDDRDRVRNSLPSETELQRLNRDVLDRVGSNEGGEAWKALAALVGEANAVGRPSVGTPPSQTPETAPNAIQ